MTLEIRAGREPFTQNASPRSHNSGAAAARSANFLSSTNPNLVLFSGNFSTSGT
jgi:hypothetical protein